MPLRRRGQAARRHPERRAPDSASSRSARGAVMPALSFEGAVERTLDALPPPIRRLLEDVAIVVEDEPTEDQRREMELDEDGTLYGLYEGTPATLYGADWAATPNKITLFRRPLEEDFPEPAELREEVRRTVLHELAHHAGIEDQRLEELGFD